MKRLEWKLWGTEEAAWGPTSRRKATQSAAETDPGQCGCRKKLAVTCRRIIRRVITPQRKGHCCQGQGKNKVVPRSQKGWTIGKRRRAQPESISGIRIQGLKKQLRLGKEKTSGRIIRKALVLVIAKRTAGSSVRIRKMSVRTLWRGRPFRNGKRECMQSKSRKLRSTDHCKYFACTYRKKDLYWLHHVLCHYVEKRFMIVQLDRLTPYEGTARDERP
jgi:hypothetical protein